MNAPIIMPPPPNDESAHRIAQKAAQIVCKSVAKLGI